MGFLKATMSQDLDAGTVRGVEALAKNWAVFTKHFRDVYLHLDRLGHVTENSLVATTTTSLTITRNTLKNLFPGLACHRGDQDKESKLSRIAARLVGQRIVVHGSVLFYCDTSTHCIVSLITQGDMVTPLLQVLDNLEDVSLVFHHARINPEGNLVEGEYLDQYNLCY